MHGLISMVLKPGPPNVKEKRMTVIIFLKLTPTAICEKNKTLRKQLLPVFYSANTINNYYARA